MKIVIFDTHPIDDITFELANELKSVRNVSVYILAGISGKTSKAIPWSLKERLRHFIAANTISSGSKKIIDKMLPKRDKNDVWLFSPSILVDTRDSIALGAILDMIGPDVGIIQAAPVLTGDAIRRFQTGIINIHPARIPEYRGVSSLARSILNGDPIEYTIHFIDERIDAGRQIAIKKPGMKDVRNMPAIRRVIRCEAGKEIVALVRSGEIQQNRFDVIDIKGMSLGKRFTAKDYICVNRIIKKGISQ